MEKMRRMASGRLSEIFGEKSLETDKFMRTIGCRRSAEQAFELLEDNDFLEAYADGINDYVQSVDYNIFANQKSATLLPPDFFAFWMTKSNYNPWAPIDSLAIVYLQSQLS